MGNIMEALYCFTDEVKLKKILATLNITIDNKSCYDFFNAYKNEHFGKKDLERSLKVISFINNSKFEIYGLNKKLAILLLDEEHLSHETLTSFVSLVKYLKRKKILEKLDNKQILNIFNHIKNYQLTSNEIQDYLHNVNLSQFDELSNTNIEENQQSFTINSFLDLTSLLNKLNIKLNNKELSLIFENYLNKTTTIAEIEKSIKIIKLIPQLNSITLVKSEKLTAINILTENQISEENLIRIHYIMTGIYHSNKSEYFDTEKIKDLFNKTLDIPPTHLKSTFKKVCTAFEFEKDDFNELNLQLHQIGKIKPSMSGFQNVGIRYLNRENSEFIIGQIIAFSLSLDNSEYTLSEEDTSEILDKIIENKLSIKQINSLIKDTNIKKQLTNNESINLKELLLTPSFEENLETLKTINQSFNLVCNSSTKLEHGDSIDFLKYCLDNICKRNPFSKNIETLQSNQLQTLKCLMKIFNIICKSNNYSHSSIFYAKRITQTISENMAKLNLSLTPDSTLQIINNIENKSILTKLDGLENHITKLIIDINKRTNNRKGKTIE